MKKMLRGMRRLDSALEEGGKFCGVAAAMVGAAAIGAAGSAYSAKKSAKAASESGKLDPRLGQMLFGADEAGTQGLLGKYQGMLDTPRSGAATGFAGAGGDYLSNFGGSDMGAIRQTALGAMGGYSAPTAPAALSNAATGNAAQSGGVMASLPAYAQGSMVDAPSQNGMNLSGSYDRFVNGKPGANQYLDQSINGAIAQNRLGFQQLQDDSTKNLLQNIMPSIRGGAIAAGQYGGSRQGIAEGNAIGTQQTELARAAAQFGQNATNASVNAKAGAYESDSNRALSATQGLGAQQYGVAQQDAATKNAAEFMNVGNSYDVSKTNAGFAQQTNLANQGAQQQMNLANMGNQQQTNMANLGNQQQVNLANLSSQLQTNGLNNSASLGGAGLLSGLLGQASGTVNANDNWSLDRASQVNGLLAPYMTGAPTQQVYASNSGAAALGGGLAGLSMGNSLAGMFKNSGGNSTQFSGQSMGSFSDLFGGSNIGGSYY